MSSHWCPRGREAAATLCKRNYALRLSPEFRCRYRAIAISSSGTSATALLREVETLLLAAVRICLLSGDQIQTAMQLGDEVGRILTALRRSLGAPHMQQGAGINSAAAPAPG